MASPFGISDDAFKKSAGKTLNEVVEDWGNIAMNDLRESLQSKVKLTTSKGLEQSILAQPIAFDGKTLSVSITALPYADFLNEGVQGAGGDETKYAYYEGLNVIHFLNMLTFKIEKNAEQNRLNELERLKRR